MNLDDHTYQLIDQYLQGELSGDHPFVQRLKVDEALALEVEVQRAVSSAVVDYRLMSVEKLIANKRTEFLKQGSQKWKWVLWSLPVLLIGTVAIFYSTQTKQEATVSKEKLSVKEVVTLSENTEKVSVKPIQENTPVVERKEMLKPNAQKATTNEVGGEMLVIPEVAPVVLKEVEHAVMSVQPEKTAEITSKPEGAKMPVNPCLAIRMKAFVEESRPCIGTSEGTLTVKDARGGAAPYHFSLDGKHFQETNMFTGLKSNEYNIILRDANGCLSIVYDKYPLKSKSCTQFSEHVFNPNVGNWEVPSNVEKPGELAVFDRGGQRIYFKPFEKAEKLNWGGTQNSGELLLPGVYIYSIKYSDGVVDQGRITITY